MSKGQSHLGVADIGERILLVRGQKVMLDSDLAALYGATTKQFNQAVRRNLRRFPPDFMFRLDNQEVADLRSQIVTSSSAHGGRRYAPYVFTEHGAIMAATILNTARATEVSVFVVRAFVELRQALARHIEVAKRLEELEARVEKRFGEHDQALAAILDAIRNLMTTPEPRSRSIGFVRSDDIPKPD